MILDRNRADLRIELQILQISFDQGRTRLQHVHESAFSLDRTVDNLIHGEARGGKSRARSLRTARHASEEDSCDGYNGWTKTEHGDAHSRTFLRSAETVNLSQFC